jgi:Glycosyltransferase family 87
VALSGRATDFTRDYVAAHWLADGKPLSTLDGSAGNAEAVRLGADPVLVPCGPFHLHPPPASLLVRVLVPLGFRGAAIVWMLISIAALAILARVLLSLSRRPVVPATGRESVAAFLALAAWPPAVMNIAYGQWSIILATLIAVGWWSLERGRPRSAIAAFAAAITLKTTPAVILGYLGSRHRRLSVGVLGAVLLSVTISWPLVGGLDAWSAFFRDANPDVLCWEAYVDNTVSVSGIVARLFIGGPYVLAPWHAPALAHLLGPIVAFVLIGAAGFITWRQPTDHPTSPTTPTSLAVQLPIQTAMAGIRAPVFAMWAALVALLNPLSWTHNALFLLLPAVLIVRQTSRASIRIAIATALVALSIPRETLFSLAGPLPFVASRAWVLGIHAIAGLTVFASAASESRQRPGKRQWEV